jgi:hypothetical protein
MMIEYFHSIENERPVVLIYGNEPKNVEFLKNVVHDFAKGGGTAPLCMNFQGLTALTDVSCFFPQGHMSVDLN